jgi:peptide-methionine (S)-S-oxide reductase
MDNSEIRKIGFGGGCHWCTEAYFQVIRGVIKVEQGWISATSPNNTFSEGIIVYYDPKIISLKILIEIHLRTHASTKSHSFRKKYRSAVYVFDGKKAVAQNLISELQLDFRDQIITQVLLFDQFKLNIEQQLNYYKKNKESIFCERYIVPKLQLISIRYHNHIKQN